MDRVLRFRIGRECPHPPAPSPKKGEGEKENQKYCPPLPLGEGLGVRANLRFTLLDAE